jgi:hypothetical protein
MFKRERAWLRQLSASLVLFLAACSAGVPRDESTAALLPNLIGYNVENTLNITDALTKAGAGAALAGGQVQFAAAVGVIGNYAACLQRAGAIEGRTYLQQENPLKAGLIIVVNRNKLTDPQTLLGCALPQPPSEHVALWMPQSTASAPTCTLCGRRTTSSTSCMRRPVHRSARPFAGRWKAVNNAQRAGQAK